eukprot:1144312-Pelagomonas_calceolata.AAC.1
MTRQGAMLTTEPSHAQCITQVCWGTQRGRSSTQCNTPSCQKLCVRGWEVTGLRKRQQWHCVTRKEQDSFCLEHFLFFTLPQHTQLLALPQGKEGQNRHPQGHIGRSHQQGETKC